MDHTSSGFIPLTFNYLLVHLTRSNCVYILYRVFPLISGSEPKSGKTPSCLPEHCAILSACAHSILLDACEKLSTGEAVVEDLQKISQKRIQMERLCSVVSIWKGLKKQHPKDHLARRLNECDNFIARQQLLRFLCSQVSVPVAGKYI